MNEEQTVSAIKKGILQAKEFDEFDKPLMGIVFIELLFIAFFCGVTAFAGIYYGLFRQSEVVFFTMMIYSLLLTVGFFVLFVWLLHFEFSKKMILILLSVAWSVGVGYAAKTFTVDWAGVVGIAIVFFLLGLFVHFRGVAAVSEY